MSMRLFLLWTFVAAGTLWLLATPPPAEPPAGAGATRPPQAIADQVELAVFAPGLDQPVDLAWAPGDAGRRLFVAEKTGRVRILRPAEGGAAEARAEARPFLDLSGRVSRSARQVNSEQGLLGLAFHPRFAENGRFYVNFTDRAGDTRVLELRASKDDPDLADPASERELLFVDQPFSNHNGGALVFGPDGLLYVGLGDGGGAGDPLDAAQNDSMLLGKMLRIDVDGPRGRDGKPEPRIWQKGLRNPWRYAFDRKTGDLYIADVGQYKYEEVNVVAAGSRGGENFGWDIVEGLGHCFKERNCDQRGLVQPVVEYGHDDGCSITGGFVYRGKALPELDGCYFYADYCTALIRSFRWKGGEAADHWEWRPVLDPGRRLATLSSFGQDPEGELYLLSLGDGEPGSGKVLKLVRAAR